MIRQVNHCAHDWLISLTQQDDESELDLILISAIQSVLFGTKLIIYINKFLDHTHRPKQINLKKTQSPLILSDDQVDEIIAKVGSNKIHIGEINSKTVTYFPIYHFGDVLGFVLAYGSNEFSNPQISTAVSILNVYANQLFTLFRAKIDPLSELLNRQTFDKKIQEILSGQGFLSPRTPIPADSVWHLAMLDIDHFKRVNDQYGHVIGDEVIILIARLIKNSFRSEDYVFRYGGEEFAILFQCKKSEDAFQVLERLRSAIEEFEFPQVGKLTISAGFTSLVDYEMVPALVQKADLALYHSKNSGRNKVANFDQIAESTNGILITGNDPELF
ncbi:GGDEF domain-containing protein [Pseudoalteromonas denitrificans]|uniref:diguanylate cyclase n=1 Tax=Pseudoalteromonas denitrificans DSM 6059 TaxID=1123010 RepID=A0A1I1L909_9GAMM|nr:GGDEF domain-containing protein [Pseudoalteromonas denitrificans]SFC69587.1 diguanylate cyclase (GGDEF) domain-containing protein [Pseudoalteromonas denitrificans DSM 6059]